MLARISRLIPLVTIGGIAWLLLSDSARSAPPPNQQQIQQAIQQAQQQAQQQQQQMMQYLQQLQQAQQQRMQQAQQIGQQQAQRNAQQAQQVARQMQQAARQGQKNQPQMKDVTTTYEVIIADEGLVRTMALLTPELDDKGRPKKLDAEERKKLKGDTDAERKFTGYKATIEDLQAGDEVIVTLARHRPVKGAKKKKDADGDDDTPKMKGKAKEKDGDDEEKPKAKAKAKEKDADDEEKPKAKAKAKEKDADDEDKPKGKKEKEGDGDEKEVKKIDQSMWRTVGTLMGTISEIDAGGSRRMVIRITQKQWVAPNQGGQGGGGGAGAGNNNNISIDPATMQATLVVITKRGTGTDASPGAEGTGFGGFGK
jgi:multidrug efflux pump subunit AcrA (membrane-fusion protein)